jgi:integrase
MASTRRSVTRAGAVRWQAIWRCAGPDGAVRQRTRNFATLKEARTCAGEMERNVERRGVHDAGRHTVEQYLRKLLDTLADRGEHSPATISMYRGSIGLACRTIGSIALEKLTAADLDTLYAALLRPGAAAHGRTRSAVSVLGVHRVLNAALEQARKWKLIAENPARDATPPSPRRSAVKAFTQEEVDRLLAAARAADHVTYTIVVTLLVTGPEAR